MAFKLIFIVNTKFLEKLLNQQKQPTSIHDNQHIICKATLTILSFIYIEKSHCRCCFQYLFCCGVLQNQCSCINKQGQSFSAEGIRGMLFGLITSLKYQKKQHGLQWGHGGLLLQMNDRQQKIELK